MKSKTLRNLLLVPLILGTVAAGVNAADKRKSLDLYTPSNIVENIKVPVSTGTVKDYDVGLSTPSVKVSTETAKPKVVPSTSTFTSVEPSTSTLANIVPSTGTLTDVEPSTSTLANIVPSTGTLTGVEPSTSTLANIVPSTGTLTGVEPSTGTDEGNYIRTGKKKITEEVIPAYDIYSSTGFKYYDGLNEFFFKNCADNPVMKGFIEQLVAASNQERIGFSYEGGFAVIKNPYYEAKEAEVGKPWYVSGPLNILKGVSDALGLTNAYEMAKNPKKINERQLSQLVTDGLVIYTIVSQNGKIKDLRNQKGGLESTLTQVRNDVNVEVSDLTTQIDNLTTEKEYLETRTDTLEGYVEDYITVIRDQEVEIEEQEATIINQEGIIKGQEETINAYEADMPDKGTEPPMLSIGKNKVYNNNSKKARVLNNHKVNQKTKLYFNPINKKVVIQYKRRF